MTEVNALLSQGYLISSKHPTADLTIYNYSNKSQYEGYWNDITRQCRGLILDSNGVAHSATFNKFFNHGQTSLTQVPEGEAFFAYEKMDGSFAASYFIGDEVFLCTKGSFNFTYVDTAMEILNTQYAKAKVKMQKGKTYIFELIFPAGRIVVDYGDRRDLVLTAVFDIETGDELDLDTENPGFPTPSVEFHPAGTDVESLISRNEKNREGFVFKFVPSGHRMKGKYADYVYQHRIITNVTTYDIWEALRTEGGISEDILTQVPDEFHDWVKLKEKLIREDYDNLVNKAIGLFGEAIAEVEKDRNNPAISFEHHQRALFAAQAKKYAPLSGLLFNIFNDYMEGKLLGQSLRDSRNVWMMVKPAYERPFDFSLKQALQAQNGNSEGPSNSEVEA